MIRIGILGAARIAPRGIVTPANDAAGHRGGRGRVARPGARAGTSPPQHSIPLAFGCYAELLARDDIDLVYVPLPPVGAPASGARPRSPMANTCWWRNPSPAMREDAAQMVAAARAADRHLIEGFHYRFHPLFLRALEALRGGAIGAHSPHRSDLQRQSARQARRIALHRGARRRRPHGPRLLLHALDPQRRRRRTERGQGHRPLQRRRASTSTIEAELAFTSGPTATLKCSMQPEDGVLFRRLRVQGDDGTAGFREPGFAAFRRHAFRGVRSALGTADRLRRRHDVSLPVAPRAGGDRGPRAAADRRRGRGQQHGARSTLSTAPRDCGPAASAAERRPMGAARFILALDAGTTSSRSLIFDDAGPRRRPGAARIHAILSATRLGRTRRAGDLGHAARHHGRRVARRRAHGARHRRGRHHQPARNHRVVGARDRHARGTRHRLAGPAHRRSLRSPARRGTRKRRSPRAPACCSIRIFRRPNSPGCSIMSKARAHARSAASWRSEPSTAGCCTNSPAHRRHVTDATNASRTLLYNLRLGDWDPTAARTAAHSARLPAGDRRILPAARRGSRDRARRRQTTGHRHRRRPAGRACSARAVSRPAWPRTPTAPAASRS